jgi:hypothetical protein
MSKEKSTHTGDTAHQEKSAEDKKKKLWWQKLRTFVTNYFEHAQGIDAFLFSSIVATLVFCRTSASGLDAINTFLAIYAILLSSISSRESTKQLTQAQQALCETQKLTALSNWNAVSIARVLNEIAPEDMKLDIQEQEDGSFYIGITQFAKATSESFTFFTVRPIDTVVNYNATSKQDEKQDNDKSEGKEGESDTEQSKHQDSENESQD